MRLLTEDRDNYQYEPTQAEMKKLCDCLEELCERAYTGRVFDPDHGICDNLASLYTGHKYTESYRNEQARKDWCIAFDLVATLAVNWPECLNQTYRHRNTPRVNYPIKRSGRKWEDEGLTLRISLMRFIINELEKEITCP